MKQMKIIALTLLSFLLLSCEKEIPIEVGDVEPKPVLNGLFTNGDTINVSLSNSAVVGSDDEPGPVENAIVELSTGTGFTEQLTETEPGIYQSDITAQANRNYTIEVQSEAGDCSASAFVPDTVEVVRIDTIQKTSISAGQWSGVVDALNIEFTFNDLPGNHYYVIRCVREDSVYNYTHAGDVFYYEYNYRSSNSGVTGDDGIQFWNYLYFPDYKFDSSQKTYKFGMVYESYEMEAWIDEGVDIYLMFYSLSEDYYNFITTTEVYWESHYNFFAEAINVHSNVDGGLGIFAGMSVVPVKLDLDALFDGSSFDRE